MDEHTLIHLIIGTSIAMVAILGHVKTINAILLVALLGFAKEMYDHFFVINHYIYCSFDEHLLDWLSNMVIFPIFIFYRSVTKKEISFEFALTWMLAYFAITPHDIGQSHRIRIEKISFKESAIRLQNPYRGFVPMACKNSPSSIPYSTVYSTITWKELEPTEGKYRWDLLEKCWGTHIKKGRQVAFRFQVLSPDENNLRTYPQWFIKKNHLSEKSFSIDGVEGKAFDWNHPEFFKAHERLIHEMARRYDKNPNVAWVEIGSYGFWGEWHMHGNSELAASLETRTKIYHDYQKSFTSVPLVIPFDDKEISSLAVTDRHSVRNDCLGPKRSNNHFNRSMASLSTNILVSSHAHVFTPSELCGGPDRGEQYIYDLAKNDFEALKQQRISTIGPNGAEYLFTKDKELLEAMKQVNHHLGYKYVIRESQFTSVLMPEDDFEIKILIDNSGSSSLPDKLFDTIISFESKSSKSNFYAETNEKWDAAHWDPGEHILKFNYPAYLLEPGDYKVFLSLKDRRNKKSFLKFSNARQVDKTKIEVGYFKIIGQADREQ